MEGLCLEVHLEPVAGVERDVAAQGGIGIERRGHLFGDPAESCQFVERYKVMADANGG